MAPAASLTGIILFAVSIVANPIAVRQSLVSIPFVRQFNVNGSSGLVLMDQARAKSLVALGSAIENRASDSGAIISVDVTNAAVAYHTSVGVGSPAIYYTLLMDTGSANTWVGAEKTYVRTSTSVQTNDNVSVSYGTASFSGTEFTDTVTIAPGVVIPGQSIGVASTFRGLRGADGILGIGPTNLSIGTLLPSRGNNVPTVTDNLFGQGTITSNLISIYFEPTNTTSVTNGELTFGGTDPTKFTGDITFFPLTKTYPASRFWGINQSIRYGTSTLILTTTAGIVDTGTSLTSIATDAYNRYCDATGAVLDSRTGLLRITPAQYSNLQSLFFTTGNTTFELTANAQIWPRALNSFIGGTVGDIYLVIHDLGTPSGQGFDFVNGYTFLERFYSVFDTGNHMLGLANTPFTTAMSN